MGRKRLGGFGDGVSGGGGGGGSMKGGGNPATLLVSSVMMEVRASWRLSMVVWMVA